MHRFFAGLLTFIVVSWCASSAQATERVACKSLPMLQEIVTLWVPMDNIAAFQEDCSILTSEFIRDELAGASRAFVDSYSFPCESERNEVCTNEVWIIRLTYDDIIFYYELGFMEIASDMFEEGVVGVEDLDGPILAYGLPGGITLPVQPKVKTLAVEINN